MSCSLPWSQRFFLIFPPAREPWSSKHESRSSKKEKPLVTLDLNLTFMQKPGLGSDPRARTGWYCYKHANQYDWFVWLGIPRGWWGYYCHCTSWGKFYLSLPAGMKIVCIKLHIYIYIYQSILKNTPLCSAEVVQACHNFLIIVVWSGICYRRNTRPIRSSLQTSFKTCKR